MRATGILPAAAAIVAAMAPLVACGWHAGMGTERAQLSGASVGVEIFDLDGEVLERQLEPALHRELSRALSDLVQAPLAAPERADLVVRGRIREYRRYAGVRSPDNELLETGVRFAANAELVRRRTGAVVSSSSAAIWSSFAVGDPENEVSARERAIRHAAETLILDLFRSPPAGESRPEPTRP